MSDFKFTFQHERKKKIKGFTQSLPCKGDKTYNDVMMTNAFKINYVIYYILAAGDFGRSGRHWVNVLVKYFVALFIKT